jgi:hypothetical protein
MRSRVVLAARAVLATQAMFPVVHLVVLVAAVVLLLLLTPPLCALRGSPR